MMKINCPNCNHIIPTEDVNISTDLGKCSKCDVIFKLSEVVYDNKPVNLSLPIGSSLEFIEGFRDSYEIVIPRKGFSAQNLFPIGFNIFWLCFVAFWTAGASMASIFFAMFSIPFWIVGILMLIGNINAIYEYHRITLDRNYLTLEKIRPIKSKFIDYSLEEIVSVKLQDKIHNNRKRLPDANDYSNLGNTGKLPAIISGKGTEYFFENANDAEKEWVVNLLDTKVKEFKR